MTTIPEGLAIALQHHQAGRLQAAEHICRQIIAVDPNQPDAIYLLGVIAHQVGQHDAAVEFIKRAIGLKRTEGVFHTRLGNVFLSQGKLDEATACFRRALELQPGCAEAHNNLGIAFNRQGKLDEATACYLRALELQPDLAEVHYNLGNSLVAQGKLDETAACYRRALELKPDFAEARNNLDNIELDYVQRWLRSGGSLHRCDHIQDFDAYLNIDGWFDFQDIYDTAVAEARPGGVFVEVGCWKGRSTAYLGSRVAMAQKQVSIYAIDPWLGWADGRPVSVFGQFFGNMAEAGLIDIVTPLRMVSAQGARLFDDRSVDFCFIDGDHRYKAVSEDLRCWFPKIRPGGLIGGHDYVGPDSSLGVKQAVDEFFPRPVRVSGKSWLVRREP
jgi:Tfp pilus assembly protein PilF